MNSKDQFLKIFLDGTIHLSKKDYSFFYNLSKLIAQQNYITSNQLSLFDKLVTKYQRQLRKEGYNSIDILNLPFSIEVRVSSINFLQAAITIHKDQIQIKAPFKNEFVSCLRKEYINDFENTNRKFINRFEWNKEKKFYAAPLTTISLKIAIMVCEKYFSQIKLCERTSELLNQLNDYENCTVWEPMLKKIGSHFYIACHNQYIDSQLDKVDKSDLSKFFYALSRLGVKIDPNIVKDNHILQCAANYICTVDLDNLLSVVETMNSVGIKKAVLSRDIKFTKNLEKEIKNLFSSYHIEVLTLNETTNNLNDYFYFTLNSSMAKTISASKIVHLTNSRPVVIK